MYDLIGDIHGYAEPLKRLLRKLGYELQGGVFKHPERKVIFIGDFIDRGPDSKEAVRVARSMTESGSALAVMGNHEYNAISFATGNREGYYRPHSFKNIKQLCKTLSNYRPFDEEWVSHLKWMMSLPLFLELPEGLRAVHASWNTESIDFMKENYGGGIMTDAFVDASHKEGSKEYWVIGDCLIGQELELPEGISFQDSDGRSRNDMRVKWWSDPFGCTFNEIGLSGQFPEIPVDDEIAKSIRTYPADDMPLFFGHYWLKGEPHIQTKNVCCLDFSIAKGGVLAAYRWNGEKELRNENMICVK